MTSLEENLTRPIASKGLFGGSRPPSKILPLTMPHKLLASVAIKLKMHQNRLRTPLAELRMLPVAIVDLEEGDPLSTTLTPLVNTSQGLASWPHTISGHSTRGTDPPVTILQITVTTMTIAYQIRTTKMTYLSQHAPLRCISTSYF